MPGLRGEGAHLLMGELTMRTSSALGSSGPPLSSLESEQEVLLLGMLLVCSEATADTTVCGYPWDAFCLGLVYDILTLSFSS